MVLVQSQGCGVSGDQPVALPHLCLGPKERQTVRSASPEHLCPVPQGTAGCQAEGIKGLCLTEISVKTHRSVPSRERQRGNINCFLLRGLEVEVDNSLGKLCAICMTENTPDPPLGP